MKGTVKWFDDVNGVGFIVPDTAGEDAFVHWTSIVVDGFKSLAEGQRVEYDTAVSAYGPTAKNVKILDE
jgi:CspA family cold shock protein